MNTTTHFEQRAKERSTKNMDKFLKNAIQHGVYKEDLNPKSSLYYYIDRKVHEGYHAIVYKDYIIIQSDIDNVFITLYKIPVKLKGKAVKAYKQKKQKELRTSGKRERDLN